MADCTSSHHWTRTRLRHSSVLRWPHRWEEAVRRITMIAQKSGSIGTTVSTNIKSARQPKEMRLLVKMKASIQGNNETLRYSMLINRRILRAQKVSPRFAAKRASKSKRLSSKLTTSISWPSRTMTCISTSDWLSIELKIVFSKPLYEKMRAISTCWRRRWPWFRRSTRPKKQMGLT